MHATATDVIVTIVFWAVMVFVAGLIFQKVCDLCGAELPSFRRSVLITVLVAAAAFFTFDGTGYGIMLATRDSVNLNLPPGYNYGNWLREPLYLKWQVMGLVPILRYLPIVFAGCMAATLYVLILAEPFRNCLVILLIQWTLNVAAMAILSFALTNIVHFMVPAQPESTELAAQQDPNVAPRPPEVRAATRPKPHRLTRRPEGKPEKAPEPETPKPAEGEASPAAGSDLKAALADHKGNPESSFAQLREQLHALDEHAKPYLEPIETACAPYTKYLPEPVQEFLEDGGWWLVFAALAVAVLFWLRALYRRGKRALFHKHRHHRKARRQ